MTQRQNGIALIIMMIILAVTSVLALSMAAVSATSLKVMENNHKANSALSAAQSGIEYAKYFVARVPTVNTPDNDISNNEANSTWLSLCQYLHNCNFGAVSVKRTGRFPLTGSIGDEIITNPINFGTQANFSLRFYRCDSSPNTVKVQSVGSDDSSTRTIEMAMQMQKSSKVLEYAVAGCGRIMLTGDTTIDGPIFSTWHKPQWASPVETTAGTTVNGSISTVLTREELTAAGIQLESLDANGNPMFDEDGHRIYGPDDKVQGYYEGINYDQPGDCMPGLSENDYDTSSYKTGCSVISASSKKTSEYFPHKSGDYTKKKENGDYLLSRHVYENQTYTNARLPKGRNALFKNCTFEGTLFIESTSNSSQTTKCNNVRFENCQFNGIIVTDVPKNNSIQWIQNCLYFTGEEHFNNTSAYQDATILAPNFNVNLGNTAVVEEGDESVITGAIVGGIVDVRGNAQINGTIISMYDTSKHPSGYVSNIGFANDGGSEGGVPEDVGVIRITCSPSKLLPSGVTSPIAIKPLQNTYSEIHN